MKNIFFIFLSTLISSQVVSQSLIQLSPLIEIKTINEADIFLQDYRYKYSGNDTSTLQGVVYDTYLFSKTNLEFNSSGTVTIYKNKNKNFTAINLQFRTTDTDWFNQLKKDFERNTKTVFLAEKIEDGYYKRFYKNDKYQYSFWVITNYSYPIYIIHIIDPNSKFEIRVPKSTQKTLEDSKPSLPIKQKKDWVYSTETKQGEKWYFKGEYVTKENNLIKVWLKLKIPTFKVKGKSYKDVDYKLLVEFNCLKNEVNTYSYYVYDKEGILIHSSNNSFPEKQDIVPETAMEITMKAVCKYF